MVEIRNNDLTFIAGSLEIVIVISDINLTYQGILCIGQQGPLTAAVVVSSYLIVYKPALTF